MYQKLTELVSEIYLAEERKKPALWKRVAAALKNMKVPQAKIDQILQTADPACLAKFLEEKQ